MFGIRERLTAESADRVFDHINACLAKPEFRPRALYERFNVEVIATTESPLDPLAHHTKLRHILMETHWRVAAAGTCRKARARLSRQPVSVIVCERDLPDGTWRDILALFADANEPPLVTWPNSAN